MVLVRQLMRDEGGSPAIEVGLIVGLLAVASITALTALGDSVDLVWAGLVRTTTGAPAL